MSELITSLYNDLSNIFLYNGYDVVLYNVLDLLCNVFAYMVYLVLIILIFSICIDLIKFVYKGGVSRCPIL